MSGEDTNVQTFQTSSVGRQEENEFPNLCHFLLDYGLYIITSTDLKRHTLAI